MTGILIDTNLLIAFHTRRLDEKTKAELEKESTRISIISWFEFEKWMLKHEKGAQRAFVRQRLENTFETVSLDVNTCRKAAELSHTYGLSTADALIYATAQVNGWTLATSDSDLKGKPGVLYAKPMP